MAPAFQLSPEYWETVQIGKQDLEALQTHLFEVETPLTAEDLTAVFVSTRLKAEKQAREAKRLAAGRAYRPRDRYVPGDELVFPALDWKRGKVLSSRPGVNPEVDAFDVITVELENGARQMFAAGFETHALNAEPDPAEESVGGSLDDVVEEHGAGLEQRLAAALAADDALVNIAGRWFPRGLLIEINEGQLNLAEAVLDMAQGEPQPAMALLKDVELPSGVNPRLAEFSLNRALQDDPRFDEVGPAGQVLWCLHRLEPEGVRTVPTFLQYKTIPHDASAMDDAMRLLESQLDDELSQATKAPGDRKEVKEITISLIYPHLRAGTLPVSERTKALFPTAYESPSRTLHARGRTFRGENAGLGGA